MKNSLKYILILGTLALGACSKDYLDVEPQEGTDENFYNNPTSASYALVGCYDGMQIASGGIGGLSFPVASEVLSDNCFGGTGNSDGYGFQAVDEFDISRSPADANLYENNWIQYYRALYRCNVLIQKMADIDWGDDADIKVQYESEARFIRAHLYFEMVRLWGHIPLIIEPTTENIPQADPDEVYKVIAEDLVYAAENLPEEPYTEAESGRVTKWAAEAMIARVFLYYTGYYNASDLVGVVNKAQALTYLEDVIANSGHSLVDDFAKLWPATSVEDYAGEDNPEVVFSVKHTYTSDFDGNTDGNHWMVMFGMRDYDHYPYGRGWGVTVNPKLWKAYNENDTRRGASVIAIDEEEIPYDKQDGHREYTGYYNKKYSPVIDEDGNSVTDEVGGENFQIGQFQDYFVMRYADVLLMAAELGSSNAQAYFDQVRQRAYKENFTAIPANPQNILKERQLEFALEGIRYWDLLRQGISTAAAELAENTTVLNGGVETNKVISAQNVESTGGLQQIPNNQITLSNGVLQQNTGW
ncbi:RagB/SusD family nutrient uptake outer membrane protein [Sinomicrobium kalidii]|uniref:RagB/SusD family nutrient uptake outer membrane protein n=1 Tax=Sinomicrobium kalidii TaxID=2900738 RepID=UPI001E417D79|nr:RagB/SusD family nutrient uptake outer membrane protein [Sinomicrobium kalidii]UGU16197.1 RagB/SusD family nutrient uptake outer membrane protein [Sinomicrobium kalidii]